MSLSRGSVSRGFLFVTKTDNDRHRFAWLYYYFIEQSYVSLGDDIYELCECRNNQHPPVILLKYSLLNA